MNSIHTTPWYYNLLSLSLLSLHYVTTGQLILRLVNISSDRHVTAYDVTSFIALVVTLLYSTYNWLTSLVTSLCYNWSNTDISSVTVQPDDILSFTVQSHDIPSAYCAVSISLHMSCLWVLLHMLYRHNYYIIQSIPIESYVVSNLESQLASANRKAIIHFSLSSSLHLSSFLHA